MKRIFAVAAALCLLAAPGAFAQKQQQPNNRSPKERPSVEQIARHQTERQTRELGLDENQAKKVYDLNLKQAQQTEAHRSQMMQERKAHDAGMKSLLTADQYAKWSQMQGSRPGARQGKMHKDADSSKQGCCKDGKGGKDNKANKDSKGCGKR